MSATADTGEDHGAAILITRLFTEALDARDLAALRVLVADDVEFRNREGGTLSGWDGVQAVVDAARDTDMFLIREGPEDVDSSDGIERISVPVREIIGRDDELHRTAVFEVCDKAVSAFEVLT
jgi:hypothetical protein